MIISMSCYRHALVSSKTKDSRKVYTLHLDREALLTGSNSNIQKKRRGSDSDSNWKVKVCAAVYFFSEGSICAYIDFPCLLYNHLLVC